LYGCIDCNSLYTSTLNFSEEEKNIHNNNKIYNLYTYTNQPKTSNNLLATPSPPPSKPMESPQPPSRKAQPSPQHSPPPAPQAHAPDSPSLTAQAQATGSIAQPATPVLDLHTQNSQQVFLTSLATNMLLYFYFSR